MSKEFDAQPARQVGGDEREYHCDYAGCSQKAHPGTSLCLEHHTPKARAALAPAAVVMPEPLPYEGSTESDWYAKGWNDHAERIARLNHNAIPVELLERIASNPDAAAYIGQEQTELRALLSSDMDVQSF